ncbi:MAG TPA: two-component regulator propeller domain-containing protein, partial [Flavitalea sp.]|nr:two-component regulator propeller domain-containing protein [Flavitalea sp.]
MRSIFCTVVVWSCIIGSAQAQTQQYLFSYLGLKDGLLADNILGVQQDAEGYIWIASHNALQRFDGQRFLNFYQDPSSKSSMPAGGIRGIQIDKKNRLWVLSGTNSVGYFDVSKFTYKSVRVEPPTEKAKQAGVALYIDRDDNVLLIFVGHGYLTYDEKTGGFSAVNNPFIIPDGWEPLYLYQCADRNYWSGSHNGLLKYNPVKKKLSYRGHNVEEDPVIRHFGYARTVVFATADRSGRFWIASWPDNILHIKSFTPADNQETDWFRIIRNSIGDKYFELQGITEMSDGSLWMGGINLFAKINGAGKTIQPIFSNASEEYSIRYDHVFSVYEDREKNAWVCTNEGLFRFNPGAQLFKGVVNRSRQKPSSFTSDVTDILETADKKILVSTWGNGVFSYDMKFNPVQSDYANRSTVHGEGMVWCMIQRDNGDIWKGLQGGGLNIYEAASRKTRKLHPPIFEGSTIRQIAVDKKGNIWLGTQRGHLVKWDATTNAFTLQLRLQAIVGRIYIDDRNYVWICTDKNGVY